MHCVNFIPFAHVVLRLERKRKHIVEVQRERNHFKEQRNGFIISCPRVVYLPLVRKQMHP